MTRGTRGIGVAVSGCGEWGRNHVRVLSALPGARLLHVADPRPDRQEVARSLAPAASVSVSIERALDDPAVGAVVVCSPSPTHHPVAAAALAAGKHVFVEKPLATSVPQADDLVARARAARRVLMVGHLLLHHPAVRFLSRLVARGGLGDLHYLHAQRVNLGRIRTDEGALWSLAPHDVSVMAHLLGAWPQSVVAQGAAYVQPRLEDVVFLTLRFPRGRLGHVHLSWLDPLKVRRLTLVGSRRMAVFDDMEPAEKVRVHDKGAAGRRARGREPATYGEALALRSGRTTIPRLSPAEPLREELRAFLSSIRTGRSPATDGASGARVVRVLAAAEASLRRGGVEVAVEAPRGGARP
jgi:predicted dehydrogenase